MSSFAFVVTSIFSASGRGEVDVLRGYIAHGLISFGIQFLLFSLPCVHTRSLSRARLHVMAPSYHRRIDVSAVLSFLLFLVGGYFVFQKNQRYSFPSIHATPALPGLIHSR